MKAHNAWQIEFKRDIPIQVFSLFLKAVRKARSAVHLACFYSVHREGASNQGLVRLRPNYS